MQKKNPKDRILETANKLFYEQGYNTTGINQVLSESGAHKLSLYKYYPSKTDLGRAYLGIQKDSILNLLNSLFRQKEDPKEMIQSWVKILIRQAKRSEFHGCPFANFNTQTIDSKHEFTSDLISVLQEWLELITEYFEMCKKKKYLGTKVNVKTLSRKLISIYEGNIQIYLISQNIEDLKNIETDFLELSELQSN
ncbi:MAG: TetR/AcrR family transcriptional regulator [Leptospira sp.]|nr:TetR/AcrR family transcriptional regulator [Leptospira sp.]NCS92762.1 TetR/AcrR family transcriptional regulator [Leptospira sp.]